MFILLLNSSKYMKQFLFALLFSLSSLGCASLGKSVNFFTLEDDVILGKQADAQLKADARYKFLKPTDRNYEAITRYVNRIKDKLLEANDIPHEAQFNYTVQVINDDVINAFATAGGYVYVYTGIIKFLDNEAQLAGVLAHELAHVARRHGSNQMALKGITHAILSEALKEKSQAVQALAGIGYQLAMLSYSREDENEADESGALWMSKTDYNPYESQAFFKKIRDLKNASTPPEFLSTHPNPENRIANVERVLKTLNAKNEGNTYEREYREFKKLLP
jgi:predicted Zn-dependent protease